MGKPLLTASGNTWKPGVMNDPDLLRAVKPIIQSLEGLGIPYYIGGSIASSIYGMVRATADVDLVADIKHDQVPRLSENLKGGYYISEPMINEAIDRRSSFNLIHLETMIKIDVFIHRHDAYHEAAMPRRRRDTLSEAHPDGEFYFSSPEDTVIAKLLWHQKSDRFSERQFHDVVGVMKVQGHRLDREYLEKWSQALNLSALLNEAFNAAGLVQEDGA